MFFGGAGKSGGTISARIGQGELIREATALYDQRQRK